MQTLFPAVEHPSLRVKSNALARLFNPGPDFDLINRGHTQRLPLEAYIAAKFYKDHEATVNSFMPYLLAMSCANSFSAAVGIRPANDSDLFIETYLDSSIEQYVAAVANGDQPRQSIVEIGNLVATRPGASQLIFIILTAVLYHANYRWVAFTATRQVEHMLKKLDFTCHVLCAADPARLGRSAAQWGRYYETDPHVMVIDVVDAMEKAMESRLAGGALAMYKNRLSALAAGLPGFDIAGLSGKV